MTTPSKYACASDFNPLPEYDTCNVVISEEERARCRRVVMTESDATQLKSKIDALPEQPADKAILDRFREDGVFMGIDSITSDAATSAEKK